MNTPTARPNERSHRQWYFFGVVAFLPHLLAVLLASSQRHPFDHTQQFLSELGERGSTTANLMNYFGILPTGTLIALFAVVILSNAGKAPLLRIAGGLILIHGVCRVVAALFPCDVGCHPAVPSLSQFIHNVAAAVGFLALVAAPFVVGRWLLVQRRGLAIVGATFFLGSVATASLILFNINAAGGVGLYQRIALGSLQLWLSIFALHLLLHQRGTNAV
jgi:hypothetical membrane protein